MSGSVSGRSPLRAAGDAERDIIASLEAQLNTYKKESALSRIASDSASAELAFLRPKVIELQTTLLEAHEKNLAIIASLEAEVNAYKKESILSHSASADKLRELARDNAELRDTVRRGDDVAAAMSEDCWRASTQLSDLKDELAYQLERGTLMAREMGVVTERVRDLEIALAKERGERDEETSRQRHWVREVECNLKKKAEAEATLRAGGTGGRIKRVFVQEM